MRSFLRSSPFVARSLCYIRGLS